MVTDKTIDPQSEFREAKRRNCWQSAHVSSCQVVLNEVDVSDVSQLPMT